MDITNMVWYYYNAVESDLTDVGVYLEQADGRYDLDKAASSGGNRGDGGDLFPGNTSNTTFNDKTTPNALTWSGKKSGVSIQKITQNTDSTSSFNFGPYPSASFSAMYSAICSNTSLTLTNTSVYTTSYAWNFGDSTAIDTNFSPTHTFKKAGNYTIKLLAKSSTGTDSTTMPLTVYALPGSAFTLTGVNGPTATVQNTTPSSSGGNFYTWNWGDGNTNFKSTRTVTHTFKDTGLYVVELNTINNITQCSDTFKSAIHVASLTGIAGMYQNKYMLEAYPNPFANVLNFSLTLDKPAILEVAIYNLSGQKLMTLKNGSFSSGLNAFKLESISSLAAGVYFIGVSAEGQMPSMMKIIKN
jgi:PKD repeat protein